MKRVRYGVIGVKGIGRVHIAGALQHPGAELTALVDVDAEAAHARAAELGVRAFTDYRDLLAADAVDAVSVALPHHLHAPVTLDCLAAGLHVFVEKPLAMRVSEADAMIGLARAAGLKLGVGHQYRTFRSSRVMKHLLERGALGTVHHVLWTQHTKHASTKTPHRPWRFEWATSGGGIVSYKAVHDLDLLCWLLGRPVEVTALLSAHLHGHVAGDAVSAAIRFESGTVATLQVSMSRPALHNVRQLSGDRGLLVVEDAQSLMYDHGERLRLGLYPEPLSALVQARQDAPLSPETDWHTIEIPRQLHTPRPSGFGNRVRGLLRRRPSEAAAALPHGLPDLLEAFERLPRPKQHGLFVLIGSFLDAILDGGEPAVNGANTLPAVELLNGIVLSAVTKRTVELPVDRDEYDALFEALCAGDAAGRTSGSPLPVA